MPLKPNGDLPDFYDKLPEGSFEDQDAQARLVTDARAVELAGKPIAGKFDLSHFSKVHKHLFQDVSSLAGVVRDYGMRKGGTDFATPEQIDYLMFRELPERLKNIEKSLNDQESYTTKIADIHSTLDLAHPFREGNGRSTRALMKQLSETHGYELEFDNINKERWNRACATSIAGDDEQKYAVFKDIVKPSPERAELIAGEQAALLESASIEQAYEESLAIFVQAKHDQIERIESRLEIMISRQQDALQKLGSRPRLLSSASSKREFSKKRGDMLGRVAVLEARLSRVKDIKDDTGLKTPKIQKLATRKMRAQNPELASSWDEMRRAGRAHALLEQREKKNKQQKLGSSRALNIDKSPV